MEIFSVTGLVFVSAWMIYAMNRALDELTSREDGNRIPTNAEKDRATKCWKDVRNFLIAINILFVGRLLSVVFFGV